MIQYSDVDGPWTICRCQPVGPADMNVSPSCVCQESQSHLCRLPFGFWCRNRISWCFWLTAAVLLAGLVSEKKKKKTLQAMCAVQCGSSVTQIWLHLTRRKGRHNQGACTCTLTHLWPDNSRETHQVINITDNVADFVTSCDPSVW